MIDKIKIKDGRVTYPNGKSYNYADPEEKIRAQMISEIIDKYQYPANRIDTEVFGPQRLPKLPADIVVYEDDEKETVFLIVETKAGSTLKDIEEAKREGLGNANLLNSKFLLIVCDSTSL